MASVANDGNGRRRILFRAPDGSRRTIRLGRMNARTAASVKLYVESILAARAAGAALDQRTAEWIGSLPDAMHERLAKTGLVEPRAPTATGETLAGLWQRFTATKDVKPATRAVYDRVRRVMLAHFGAGRAVDSITPEDVERWCRALTDAGYARATRAKYVHVAKGLFNRAVRWEVLDRSPFENVRPGAQDNPARQRYIPIGDLERILEYCPSAAWRCVFSLTRLAGLRCPSEVMALKWGDVDWERGTLRVESRKTEHHAGGASRVVPIVPTLREILMQAFDAAEPGAVYVVGAKRRNAGTNLRTHAHRIIRKAGLEPWPKLFVNLRASCATDFCETFPAHVAAAWLGHSTAIAA